MKPHSTPHLQRLCAAAFLATILAMLPAARAADAPPATIVSLWRDKATKAYVAADMSKARQDSAAERRAYRVALDEFDAYAQDPWHEKLLGVPLLGLYMRVADLDEREGRPDEAEAEYIRAADLAELTAMPATLRRALDRLEALYLKEGKFDLAIEKAKLGQQLADKGGRYALLKLPSLIMQARCHTEQGLNREAKSEFDAAWNLADNAASVEPDVIDALQENSAKLYRSMGNDALADATVPRAQRLRAKTPAPTTIQPRPTTVFADVPPPRPTTLPALPSPPLPLGSSSASPPPASHSQTRPSFADSAALQECKPTYPAEALANEEQGVVRLAYDISADGKLLAIRPVHSSGWPALDAATVEAFSRCRFRPGMLDGMPVAASFDSLYVWMLEN